MLITRDPVAPPVGDPLASARSFLSALRGPGPLVVAVSGGGDSMALLTALHIARQDGAVPGRSLVAVTVDHALRPDSAVEARWVGDFCAARSIEHHVVRWQGEKPASGIQAAARLARYRLISAVARRTGAVGVAVAHSLDDQMETIAMRRARAAATPSVRGLAGMAPATLFERTTWLLRPFLGLSRAGLRRWLTEHGVPWIDDPSNSDKRFERVRVRQDAALAAVDMAVPAEDRQMARSRRALCLAALISERAAVYGGPVVSFALDPACPHDDLVDAVAVLMTLAGGRPYLPGHGVMEKLGSFLGGDAGTRMNAARAVVERRGPCLYLYRERRGLPAVMLTPGAPAIYDGRYELTLAEGRSPVSIEPAGVNGATAAGPEFAGLPPGVVRRVLAAEPAIDGSPSGFLLHGAGAGVRVDRYMALFDVFLPSFDIALANACAVLYGRHAYRPPPFVE